RRIAVVAEGRAGREERIAQVVEVRHELLAAPAQLVDGGVARERHHRGLRETLDLDPGFVERARRDGAAARRKEPKLPEAGLARAATRAERIRSGRASALHEQRDVVTREDPADRRLLRLVGGRRDEEVRDGEAIDVGVRAVGAAGAKALGPQPPRYVGQDAGAIPFAVDAAGAVGERAQAGDDLREYALVGRAVLAGD